MKVRKAVIPVAGFGTRFLPATKTIPKGIIPVVDKPIILYIVESAVASGIEHITLVTSANCKPIEDLFDHNFELEERLRETGKLALLEQVQHLTTLAQFTYVRQIEPLGNGHAVLMARDIVGDEPFLMLWGDDILLGDPPVPRQLIDVAERLEAPVLAVRRVPPEQFDKYGMLAVDPMQNGTGKARSIVEKPSREESPSDLAQIGGCILTPDIFELLEETKEGTGGEIYLADALVRLMGQRDVYAYEFQGRRYDAGDKLDFLRATVELALADPALSVRFGEYLRHLRVEEHVPSR